MARNNEQRADEGSESGNIKSPAGRVEIDSRGNSVWRWARDVLESTSVLLKRLENHDLALEPTQKVPIARAAKKAPGKAERRGATSLSVEEPTRPDNGGGFDPYNSR